MSDFLSKTLSEDSCRRSNFWRKKNYPTFIKPIIKINETRIYHYENRKQSTKWRLENESKLKIPNQSRSKIKVLLAIFIDFISIEHFEYLPPDETFKTKKIHEVLKRLENVLHRNWPELWSYISWILDDCNLPSLRTRIMLNFLTKHQIKII